MSPYCYRMFNYLRLSNLLRPLLYPRLWPYLWLSRISDCDPFSDYDSITHCHHMAGHHINAVLMVKKMTRNFLIMWVLTLICIQESLPYVNKPLWLMPSSLCDTSFDIQHSPPIQVEFHKSASQSHCLIVMLTLTCLVARLAFLFPTKCYLTVADKVAAMLA